MKDRLKKKAEKRRMQKALEVCKLAFEINGLQRSKKDVTGSHPTVFLRFSGHEGFISADIHLQGWEAGRIPDRRYETPVCQRKPHFDELTLDKTVQELRQLKMDPSGGNREEVRENN